MSKEHIHKHTTAVINRLSRIAGHVSAIKKMVEEERPCPEVLIQLAAVKAAITKASRIVLEDHMESCLFKATGANSPEKELESLKEALSKYVM
jgi:CsoR family transcriptional regulator, copper-sensing transcriptional repressor